MINEITEIIEKFKLTITTVSLVVTFAISGYTVYLDIFKTIETNTKYLELTQISILKSLITNMEKYPCTTSRSEWIEYNILFSQYYYLIKKHNPLIDDMSIAPMERLTKDTCKCYKGNCDE